MAVFRDDETVRNVLAQNLLDDLRHSGACLACTNDDDSRRHGQPLAGYSELTIGELDVLLNASGGISSFQRGFPNELRALPKFIDDHPLRLLLSGGPREIFYDFSSPFFD